MSEGNGMKRDTKKRHYNAKEEYKKQHNMQIIFTAIAAG
jgi:hypothetical protein